MSDNTISINPSKPTEHEFEVTIQGIDHSIIPVVRFVIISDSADKCDESYRCNKVTGEKNKWVANLPALTHITTPTSKFRIEVIVDDYYFEPAQGEIKFIAASDVHFNDKSTKKPHVTASKVEAETKKPVKESSDLDESGGMTGGGGAEITGRYAPTNSLLKPEEDPIKNNRMRQDNATSDEFIDTSRLDNVRASDAASEVDPEEDELDKINDISDPDEHPLGDGKQYPQSDGKDGFDARRIADQIIKDRMGNIKTPEKRGSLFTRGPDGKPLITGLESQSVKDEQARKAAAVRDILGRS